MSGIRVLSREEEVTNKSTSSQEDLLPASLANERFDFVHYPLGWYYDEKLGFLPEMSQLYHMPGVNGVRDMGKDRDGKAIPPDATGTRAASQRKGGTLILPEDNRLGDFRKFLRRAPCKNGRFFYFFTGVEVQVWGDNEGQFKVVPAPKWSAFLAHLRDAKIVDPISEPAYDRLRNVAASELEAIREQTSALAESRRKAITARINGMEKEWAKLNKAGSVTAVTVKPEGEAV
jgi:hypothetical protein